MDTATATDTVSVNKQDERRTRGDVEVGDYVKRGTGTTFESPYHVVESVIDGAAITRCGRRMERQNSRGKPLTIAVVEPRSWERCVKCGG